ncbi:MAG: hypothetical protein DRJ67_06895 [Thermoprotei archaeon]|nr:MAG: hypothetical protein DRJ67_06895 [Thermoprotei archaeon]
MRVDLSFGELIELWKRDPTRLFEILRPLVEEMLGPVKRVVEHATYFNPNGPVIVIEYMVEVEEGKVGIKILHGDDPVKALVEYYEAERTNFCSGTKGR